MATSGARILLLAGAALRGSGLANIFGATLTVSGSAITGNEALGGKSGADGNREFGGNGFGGGLYSDGPSIYPSNPGTPTTLTVLRTTITQNEAKGGGGDETLTHAISAGGGLYIAADGIVCIDMDTCIFANHASGRDGDGFGFFTVCP